MAFQSAAGSGPDAFDIGTPLSMSATDRPSAPAVAAAQTARSALTLTVFEHGDPTPYEQHMLELINRARADPGQEASRFGIDLNEGLPDGTISADPQPPLSFHPLLITAARDHSQWMLDTDTFSHAGAGGSSPGDRIQAAGYVLSGSATWGENIAWGGSTATIDLEQYTVELYEALFLSPGHRANICRTSFDEIGLGSIEGIFTDDGRSFNTLMVTQNYAKSGSTPGPRLLGVVFNDANDSGFYDIGEGLAGIQVAIDGGNWWAETSSSGGHYYCLRLSE